MNRTVLIAAMVLAALLIFGSSFPNSALSSTDPISAGKIELGQLSPATHNIQPYNQEYTIVPAKPVFTWDAVPSANQYRVFVRDTSTKAIVLDRTAACCQLDTTAYLPTWGLTNAVYEWWLGALVPGSSWTWSTPINFTVNVPPPALPSGLDVNEGEGRIEITFNDDPNTFFVEVWIGPSNSPYSKWHGKNTGANSYSCSNGTCTIEPNWDSMYNAEMKAWIRAWGPGGFSGGSEPSSQWANIPVNLPSTPPIAPANLSPSGEFQPGQVSTVTWSASDDSTWYNLVVGTSSRIVYDKWFLGENIGCGSFPGTCSVTDPALPNALIPGTYNMYVRAWGPGGMSINGNSGQWSRVPVRIYCGTPTTILNNQLKWAPPTLVSPTTVNVGLQGGLLDLDDDKDYIIQMPNQPVQGALKIAGGRNVVLIGGEIYIPWQGTNAYIRDRTGVTIYDVTGTIHIEGLKISGPDLTEGFQIDARDAIIQLQNILIVEIKARNHDFDDNHPDLIQPWGGYRELRVDRFTGTSDYQGIFLKPDFGPLGPVFLNRVNLIGTPTARYLFWADIGTFTGPVTLNDVWVAAPIERQGGFGNVIWPPAQGKYPNQAQFTTDVQGNTCAVWPPQMVPRINGAIFDGIPPSGHFVTPQSVGVGYVSPGYVGQ